MKMMDGLKEKFKEFKPTSWAVNNTTVIYILAILITLYGLNRFNNLPKEQFPDIVVPTISITTVYVGNSPSDIENLITRPIEKQIKSISGAKVNKVNSVSQQDFSLIIVEFDTDIKTDIAKQKVKDAADKARVDLPADLTSQPDVQEFAFSEMPIMFLNVSGDYDEVKLKQFANKIQNRVEEIKEITRADIVGAPEREIQVNVDPYKMQVAKVSFNDIENAISRENNDISGGQVEVGNMKRTLRVKGQFNTALDMQNIVIKNIQGAPIYLRDIAEVKDTVRERESYARLDGKNVVTLNIIKRSGENLINAADNVKASIEEMKQKQELPPDLRIEFTGDQSIATKHSFNELVNTIIIGFILVLLVLMFFMGVTNAFFVALSVPLSVFVAFLFLPLADAIVGAPATSIFTGASVGGPPSSWFTATSAPTIPFVASRIASKYGFVLFPFLSSYGTKDTCTLPKFGCTLLLLSMGLFALTATFAIMLSTIEPSTPGFSSFNTCCTLPSNTRVMESVYFISVPTGIFRYT